MRVSLVKVHDPKRRDNQTRFRREFSKFLSATRHLKVRNGTLDSEDL
jgi:hypothetical protein